jgi:hypothetical protein
MVIILTTTLTITILITTIATIIIPTTIITTIAIGIVTRARVRRLASALACAREPNDHITFTSRGMTSLPSAR